MAISKKHKAIIKNGDLSDQYTRDYVQNNVVPALEMEIKELEGINDTCDQSGLGRMMVEEEQEAKALLDIARKRVAV